MLCVNSAESAEHYYSFSAFIVQSTWEYLSSYNDYNHTLRRLPPLRSVLHLYLNEDIYSSEIEHLQHLSNDHGLMIWDPDRLHQAAKFNPDYFCFFVGKMARIEHWFEIERHYDREFRWYLKVEFTVNLLNRTKGILDLHAVTDRYFEFFMFEIVRNTMIALWRHQRFGPLMDRLLVGLLNGNALDLLCAAFSDVHMNSFVRILKNLREHYQDALISVDSASLLRLAKNLYLWSTAEMHRNGINSDYSEFLRRTGMNLHDIFVNTFTSHPPLVIDRYIETFVNVTGNALL